MMRSRFWAWLAVSALVIALDQWTKQLVAAHLSVNQSIPVTSFFDLVLVFNTGAAFSFLSTASGWQRWFFVALALSVSGWLVTLLYRHANERLLPLSFALVLGGAIGNVIDRLVHGAVADFLHFHIGKYYWPAFNVADSAITVGVVLLIWDQLRGRQRKSNVPEAH